MALQGIPTAIYNETTCTYIRIEVKSEQKR